MESNFKMENKHITMVKGDTFSIGITLVDENNVPIQEDINDITMTCRDSENNNVIIFEKYLDNGITKSGTGTYVIRVAPEDTEHVDAGKYVYDVELRTNDDVITPLKGILTIDDDVSKPRTGGREYTYNIGYNIDTLNIINELKDDLGDLADTGNVRIRLTWESGAYNASGKYNDANAYRIPELIYLPNGTYKIHSEAATYVWAYQDKNYTGGVGGSFPWGGVGDNTLTISGRNYIGIFSAKLNGGKPTTTYISHESFLLSEINRLDNSSDVFKSGMLKETFTWEKGGLNTSGQYNSQSQWRTVGLVYLEDGEYTIIPNGVNLYSVVVFSDNNYTSGRALLWNVSGEHNITVNGRNYMGIMTDTVADPYNLTLGTKTMIKKNSERLDIIENNITDIPSYFTDNYYLSSRIQNLQSKLESVSKGDSFVFFTDIHIADNSCSSFPIIREILQKTTVDKVICGGDIPTAYNDGTTNMKPLYSAEAGLNAQARKYGEKIGKYVRPFAKYFGVRGNHDFHIQQDASSSMITKPYSWTYNYLVRNAEGIAEVNADKAYYYYDNTAQKIRYIFINTNDLENDAAGITQEQYNWFINCLNVGEGWSIAVIGHIPLYSGMSGYESVLAPAWEIIKAYQNKRTYSYNGDVTINVDFSSAKGKIICYFCGHNHSSENYVDDGVLTMSFLSDAKYSSTEYGRGYGTVFESSVAVIVIDKENSKIKEFNYGAGGNRELDY